MIELKHTNSDLLKIGTCSWKYDSWKDIVYSQGVGKNYLHEYAQHFPIVEIDQWFWSLFGNSVVLPKPKVVSDYKDAVPNDFKFIVKVPNAITLTHVYQKNKRNTLERNPHFLSNQVFDMFLETLTPIQDQIDSYIFQFEYLNKQKISGQLDYQKQLATFFEHCPKNMPYAIETRNQNFLNNRYFDFLRSNQLTHVFIQGYWMPPIFKLYNQFKEQIKESTVIRLIGPDRKKIEKKTNNKWDQIVDPRDDELQQLKEMVDDLIARQITVTLNVNNHFEGSAPMTIHKFIQLYFK